MANALITPQVIAKEALRNLENNLVVGNLVHREFKKEFVKVGESVTIRKPVRFQVTDGASRTNQDVLEPTTSITVDKRKHVSWKFSTQDLTMTIEEYSKRYIKPAAIELANQVDYDLCGLFPYFNTTVGTPGTAYTGFTNLSAMAAQLDILSVPQDMRRAVMHPTDYWNIANGMYNIYNPQVNQGFIRKGYGGNIATLDYYMDQNVNSVTTGPRGGTPLTNGVQTPTFATNDPAWNLVTDGWTASAAARLAAGDVITIGGVFEINPKSRVSTGALKQFVVQSAVSSDGSGNATVPILPRPIFSGPQQNAYSASGNIADGQTITVLGSANTAYRRNAAFHRDALALVVCPLEMPDSAGFKARTTHNNLSIRVVKDYDIDSDDEIIRLDIFYGVKTIYRELGVQSLV